MYKYHIYLNGQGYILEEGTYNRVKQPSFSTRFATGDYGYGDLSFWQFWVIKELASSGQDRIGDSYKFKRSYGVDIDDNELKLFHSTNLKSFDDSEDRFLLVYQEKLWALGKSSGKVYYTSDGSTWTLLTTLSSKITSYAIWNNLTDKKEYLMIGVDSGDICLIDGITNTDQWSTGIFSKISALGTYSGDLYASEDNVLYKVDSATARTEISRYGSGVIYKMITTEHLYMLIHRNGNTIVGYYNGSVLNESYQFNNFVGEDFIYSSTLYICGYRNTLLNGRHGQMYKISGELILEMKDDDTSDLGFYALYPLDYLHVNDNRSSGIINYSSNGYWAEGMIYDSTNRRVSDIEYFNGRLYWTIPSGVINETSTYLSEGYLETSWYDGGTDLIDKIFGEFLLELKEPLSSKGSIDVYYKYSDEEDWALLTTNSSLKIIEEKLNINNANKIKLKFVLKSSVSSFTPIVERGHLKYLPRGYNMSGWRFTIKAENNLKLLNGTYETRSAIDIMHDIDKLNLGNIFVFKDITGVEHNVILTDYRIDTPLIRDRKGTRYNKGLEFRVSLEILEVNEYIFGVWGKTTNQWQDYIYKWGDV